MTSTPEQIAAVICPKLAASPMLEDYITMAASICDSGFFSTLWPRAVALRAAHDFTLDMRTLGESGAVVSKSEGRLSLAFSHGGKVINDLDQTSYGVRLKELIRIGSAGVSVGYADAQTVDPFLINQQGGNLP